MGLATQVVAVAQNTLPPGFEYSAPAELVLFVFLTAVAGGAAVVGSRRLGVFERVLALFAFGFFAIATARSRKLLGT